MDEESRHALAMSEGREGDQVTVVGMDAARADEADDVERPARCPGAFARCEERRSRVEGPIGDGGVDAGQVLEHRAPGAEVQVAHLGVAHLALRQADVAFGRPQHGMRPAGEERAPGGHGCRGDGIGRGVTADPEPIEDDKDDRSRATRGAGGHAAARRARAVIPARATIPAISSGLSDAPPTNAPSIAGSARNSPMFAEVTLPP